MDATRPQAIWLLSDLHIGHKQFDQELFEQHRRKALQARARVLFLGDALEAVITGSKVANLGGMYEQVGSIVDQRKRFEDYMKGFNVLGIVDGNHERRCTRVTGYSPLQDAAENIARQQHLPCTYSPHGMFVTIRLGKLTYSLVVHHGEGGPTTFFRHLIRDFPGASLYAGGHSHDLSFTEYFQHTPTGIPKRVQCIRTGSYLHLPGYAADAPGTYGIPATGSFLLWLRSDRWDMRLERMLERPPS